MRASLARTAGLEQFLSRKHCLWYLLVADISCSRRDGMQTKQRYTWMLGGMSDTLALRV